MSSATCLIKESRRSSYGALSKAGIEYSTYLSSCNNNIRPTDRVNNVDVTSQHGDATSTPRRRPHSVYAGLSYVPFNYCDDLKIEDILKRFKEKQDANKKKRNSRRRSSSNLQLVQSISGLEDPFDYYLHSNPRRSSVNRYSSCEGLPKSPKCNQRISFSSDASHDEEYPYIPYNSGMDSNDANAAKEKTVLKGILKVSGSPFDNVRRTIDTSALDTNRYIDDPYSKRDITEKKNSYVYYDEDLQEWLKLSSSRDDFDIRCNDESAKYNYSRSGISSGSSPVLIKRDVSGNAFSQSQVMNLKDESVTVERDSISDSMSSTLEAIRQYTDMVNNALPTDNNSNVKNDDSERFFVDTTKQEGNDIAKGDAAKSDKQENRLKCISDCLNRGVSLGAMLSNGQVAKTILYELNNNVWFHHNGTNTKKTLNLDDDIESLLNTHAGTVVCLSLPKTTLIF